MRLSAIAVLLLASAVAMAQPVDSQHHTRPDLRIVKTVASAPQGTAPAVFDVVVTNTGTTGSGPFTVTDVLTPPAFFDPSNLPGQTPWVCNTFPAVNPTYLTCTHPGPLAVGNSVILQVQVQSPNPGELVNCASVSCDGDPNEENNEDCACTDFKPCHPVTIDISTGSEDGGALAPGTPDPDWQLVSAPPPVGAPKPAVTTTRDIAWVPAPPTSEWISGGNPPSYDAGTPYVYRFDFALGHDMTGRRCFIDFRYAADNNLVLTLDGAPVVTLPGFVPSNFTTLHTHSGTFVGSFGTHTLEAVVDNDFGPSGLLIDGTIRCTCQPATTAP